MKRFFTILVMCFAVLAAKAQYSYIMQESFDNRVMPTGWVAIDADGDGFNWTAMNQADDRMSPHTGDGLVASASYDNDNSAALTPDNYLISPAIVIPANANYPTLSWWVKGQDAGYAAEHYAVYISTTGQTVADFTSAAVYEGEATGEYVQNTVDISSFAGQTIYVAFRHYNITDMFFLNLDDIEVYTISTEPMISIDPTTINFGAMATGTTIENTVEVTGYNLTADITATTAAPFALSLDGITYTTSVTMPAAGGDLYVQFAPTTAETFAETITLTSGDVTATINLSGEGIECETVTEFPYETDFSSTAMNLCWTIEDANNDGSTWDYNDGFAYYTYNSSNAANDWLISPVFTLTGNEMVSFAYSAYSSYYAEKFEVYVIQGSTRTLVVPEVDVTSTDYTTQYVDLRSYTGDYQIAIHCTSAADRYLFLVTDFAVTSVASDLSTSETSIDFGTHANNSITNRQFTVEALAVTEAMTVSTEAPFAVSLDGTTFAATVSIPASTELDHETVVYVQYAPTAVGAHTGNVTITDGTLSVTVALSGEAIDCQAITTFPYVCTFAEDDATLACWEIVDANGDANVEGENMGTFAFYGSTWSSDNDGIAQYFYSQANAANDWLITPEFNGSNLYAQFDYMVRSSTYPEEFGVYVIGQGQTYANATEIIAPATYTNATFEQHTLDLSAYDNQSFRIAIHVTSAADQYGVVIDNFTVGVGAGVNEESEAAQVSIYPNPASTMLNVHAENYSNVQVINFLGQVVYSANITENDFQINVSNLSNGVYFIRLNGETTTTQKFIKK